MDAIKNEYDGPKKIAPRAKTTIQATSMDFAYSQIPAEVDAGIKDTIRSVKVSIMATGIALYRIDVGGLFIDLGFRKFGEYIDHLAEETGMSRTTFYNWEYVGEAYVKHRAELDRIGFSDDDGPTKLPFLPRALEHYTKREVFRALKEKTKREFEEWSKGENLQNDNSYKNVKIRGTGLFIGKSPLVSFAEGISPRDRHYYEALLMEGAQAIEQNEFAKVYRFYDESEAKRFDKVFQRELKALRAKK